MNESVASHPEDRLQYLERMESAYMDLLSLPLEDRLRLTLAQALDIVAHPKRPEHMHGVPVTEQPTGMKVPIEPMYSLANTLTAIMEATHRMCEVAIANEADRHQTPSMMLMGAVIDMISDNYTFDLELGATVRMRSEVFDAVRRLADEHSAQYVAATEFTRWALALIKQLPPVLLGEQGMVIKSNLIASGLIDPDV